MPGHRALQPGAALHAAGLPQLEPGRARQRHVRHHADADHDHVAVELQAALRHDLAARARPTPSKRSSSSPPCTSTPCSSSASWKKRPTSLAELALERDLLLHHDRALDAVRRGQRGGHLAADVAAADQHGALGALGVGADRVRVAERAQVVDALQVAAVDAHAGARSRRWRSAPCRTRPRPWSTASPRRSPVSSFITLVRVISSMSCSLPPLVGAEQRVLARLLALQVALRQRRPVVGRVELAADQQHRPVAALLAQPARAVGGGQAAADQQVVDLAAGHLGGRARAVGERARSRSSRARRRARAAPRRRPGRPSRRWARSRRRRAGSRSPASRPAGPSSLTLLAGRVASRRRTSSSMISSRSSGRSSRCTSPYFGTSCSIRRRIRSVAEIAGFTPSSSKCCRLRGLLQRATTRVDAVLLARDLRDQDVVLVVAGHGHDQVGALDAGALEHPQLRAVAVLGAVLELLLDDARSAPDRTRSR